MKKTVSILGDYEVYRWTLVSNTGRKTYKLKNDVLSLGGVFITYANLAASINKLLPDYDCEYVASLSTVLPSIVKSNVEEGNNIKYVTTNTYNLTNIVLNIDSNEKVITLEYDVSEEDKPHYKLDVDKEIATDIVMVIDYGKGCVSEELIQSINSNFKVALVESNLKYYSEFDIVLMDRDTYSILSNSKAVSKNGMAKLNTSGFLVVVDENKGWYLYDQHTDSFSKRTNYAVPKNKIGLKEALTGVLTVLLSKEDELNYGNVKKSLDKSFSVLTKMVDGNSYMYLF